MRNLRKRVIAILLVTALGIGLTMPTATFARASEPEAEEVGYAAELPEIAEAEKGSAVKADAGTVDADGTDMDATREVGSKEDEAPGEEGTPQNEDPSGDGILALRETIEDEISEDDIRVLADVSASTDEGFREAIETAESGDTITLEDDITVDCSGVDSGEGFVDITAVNITVDLNEHTITVKGTTAGTYLFYVESGGEFTLENGTIDGASTDDSGETERSSVTAIDSHTSGDSIILDNVTIQNFGAATSGTVYAEVGNLTITDCTIVDNETHGVYANGCNDITITGSTISRNTTSGDGGGIYIFNEHGNICMEHNTISYNTAREGGGIYLEENGEGAQSGEFAVIENTISYNQAEGDGSTNRYGYPMGSGGGIYLEVASTTASEGAGDYDLSGNTITYNEAAGYGGGIELVVDVEGREIVIKSGLIAGNSAYWGGGIDSSFSYCRSTLHLFNAIITENTALARGGGLWACPTAEATMNETFGVAIYGNTAAGRTSAWQYGLSGDEVRFEGYDTDVTDPEDASGFAHVSERALGGTLMDWYADDDSRGNRYQEGDDPVDVTSDRYIGYVASFGLHGELAEEGMALAEEDALLYIVNNYSDTVGGGIATNGSIYFGADEEETSLTVTANKVWYDENGNEMTAEQTADYSVDITLVRVDEYRNEEKEEETVTLNAADGWTWEFEDLPIAYMTADYDEATGEYIYNEHPYTYTVKEVKAVADGNFSVAVTSSDVTVNEETGNSEQTLTVANTEESVLIIEEDYAYDPVLIIEEDSAYDPDFEPEGGVEDLVSVMDSESNSAAPKTGDVNQAGTWALVWLASVVAFGSVWMLRRQSRRKTERF